MIATTEGLVVAPLGAEHLCFDLTLATVAHCPLANQCTQSLPELHTLQMSLEARCVKKFQQPLVMTLSLK